jgi:hypothetical protein
VLHFLKGRHLTDFRKFFSPPPIRKIPLPK